MIRVLVVDDHTLVRDGLVRLLDMEEDLEVVAQCGSGQEALTLCQRHEPAVTVLDYNLPDLDGLEVTRRIVAMGLPTRVLILTMYASEEYAARLIRAGAAGFLVKASSTDELLHGIHKVAEGGIYISPSIMEKMVDGPAQPEENQPERALSDRELQVLVRLARGATTREISEALELSLSTVETYRRRIREKLDLRNNADLTRFAIRRGLISLE